MLKHHRYGTGFLMEAGGRSELPTAIDIDERVPTKWKVVNHLPKPKLDVVGKPNIITRIMLQVLEELPQTVYVKGIPSSLGSAQLADHIRNPAALDQFAAATALSIAEGHVPNGYIVFLGGPSDVFVKHLIDRLYTAIAKSPETKATPEKIQKELTAYAKQHYVPHIAAMVDLQIEVKESPTYQTSRAYSKFKLRQRGYNIIGHALGYADEPLPAHVLADLKKGGAETLFNQKEAVDVLGSSNTLLGQYRPKITQAILSVFYHLSWKNFKDFVFKNQKGVNAAFESAVNTATVQMAHDKTKGKPVPETHPKPKNTTREPGPNKNLYHDERVVKRDTRGPFVKVSGSIRGTGDTSTMVVSADPGDRQWQNAQGFIIQPDPLPREAGSWVSSERVKPLFKSPDYEAFFGIYYDHPLLKPTTTAQVYWYGSKNQFMDSGRQYAMMTNDRPFIAVRIVDKSTNMGVTLKQLKDDASRDGMASANKILGIMRSFRSSVKEGKRQWFPSTKEKLNWTGTEDALKSALNDMSDKPGKPGHHPEGVDPVKWKSFVGWIRGEGEKILGLKFGAQLAGSRFTGKRMFPFSTHEIPAITRFHQNLKYSGERDKDGKVNEWWGLYLIEFLRGHKTYGTSSESYMIPINVIRADETIEPRKTNSKISKAKLLELLKDSFGKYGVSHKTDWEYQDGRGPHFIYAHLNRISVAHDNEIHQMNERLKRSTNPKIERTTFGYKVDNVEWDAYQMFVAMPPSIAAKEFGLMTKQSYSRLIVDDPQLLNKISRAVGPHASAPTSLQGLGLTPRPVKAQFDLGHSVHGKGNPWEKEDLSKFDMSFGKSYTTIPPGFFASKLGDRWEPIIKQRLNAMGHVIDTFVAGFQRANSFETQGHLWQEYVKQAHHQQLLGESELNHLLAAMAQVPGMQRGSSLGKDLHANIRTFIRYSKTVINQDTGEFVMIPKVVEALGLVKYDAPFAAYGYRNVQMSVKAPSEEVAKLMIALKLLRRSATNKTLGKAMNLRSIEGTFKIIPDMHARIMAQWRAAGFPVVADEEPGHIRRVGTTNIVDRRSIERAKEGGEQKFSRMLRLN